MIPSLASYNREHGHSSEWSRGSSVLLRRRFRASSLVDQRAQRFSDSFSILVYILYLPDSWCMFWVLGLDVVRQEKLKCQSLGTSTKRLQVAFAY
jgi:hypothetical protein